MVDKEVLTDKQNEGGYFMYNTLNVRAPPRDHVTRFARFRQKSNFFIGLKKRKAAKKLHNKIAGRVDQLNTRFPLFNPQPYY